MPSFRHCLAYFHSGQLHRRWLPKVLRIGATVWLFLYVMGWLAAWPALYWEFERWGLVKAFVALFVALGTALLIVRFTFLRAGHVEELPQDDLVSLRALAVILRWAGEVPLIYALGMGVSSNLMPIGPLLNEALGKLSPNGAAAVSSGSSALFLFSAPLSLMFVGLAVVAFLVLYSLAASIDVLLAIEFNTRAERMDKKALLGGR